jgi:hypothetical protein
MASRIETGLKGGHSSAEVIRHVFGRAGGRAVNVRVTYQLFVAGERSYLGLRDHTMRFRVENRRDLEDIHAKTVQFVEDCLDRKYGRLAGREASPTASEPLTEEQAEAQAAALAAVEGDDDDVSEGIESGDLPCPTVENS